MHSAFRMCLLFAAVLIFVINSQEVIMSWCMGDAFCQGRRQCVEWRVQSSAVCCMKCWKLKRRMARQATGVGVGSGKGVFVCVSLRESWPSCVVFACEWQGVRLKRQNGDLLVLYSCNLLRSDQPEPIMQHWANTTLLFLHLSLLSLSLSVHHHPSTPPHPLTAFFLFTAVGVNSAAEGKME